MNASTRPVFSFRFSPLSKRPIITVSAKRMRAICQPLNWHDCTPAAGGCSMNAGTKTETTTKTNVQQAVPFFGVKHIAESLRYYVEGIGFQMTNKWIDEGQLRWCCLQ